MKAMGFKKQGRNFTRKSEGYTERVSVQGSSWNSGDEPWHFYINVAVAIDGVPLRETSKFHADGRLERLAPSAPAAYDLTAANLESLAIEISGYVMEACCRIPDALHDVRTRALQGWYSPLPVPDTWLDEESA
ncbi:DUF4304 domain-containing protein [Niveibacterium sp. COAC-50]|uniref:DUF4304 domain-containing protein n=1 Tax=Niveibacterium sp. COAC-50 TaxID=2729384 RepID=UPI001556FD01|nr:DUF4304 domain-containing protein [Niveibacterium sp. COAC-50]